MSVEALKQIWPEWELANEPVGRGSYGVVYKAVRRDHGVEDYSAIKVISVPTNPGEIDSLRAQGLGIDGSKSYLKQIVHDFTQEIQTMVSLKGIQNIVSVEDYRVVERDNEIGWDIYIRMELLSPISTRRMRETEVIRLGCDLCTALEFCARRNIIHRDIKPENILINSFGSFKLGDFGIARKLGNVSGGLTQRGTYNYLAPEVAAGSSYDARVDQYSLGLVLYRYLNGNRLPFLDTEAQLRSPAAQQRAIERRLGGEKLPAPCEASPAVAAVILCACDHDPNRRFATISDMKRALQQAANSNYRRNAGAVSYGPAAGQRPVQVQPGRAVRYQNGQAVQRGPAAGTPNRQVVRHGPAAGTPNRQVVRHGPAVRNPYGPGGRAPSVNSYPNSTGGQRVHGGSNPNSTGGQRSQTTGKGPQQKKNSGTKKKSMLLRVLVVVLIAEVLAAVCLALVLIF